MTDRKVTDQSTEMISNGPENERISLMPDWPTGKVLLNVYRIRRMLGRGGMGMVYLIERADKPDIFYALKTLHPEAVSDESQKKLFLRELSTWIGLPEHPNLTGCRFFRTLEDRLGIFAEYVDGGSLKQRIEIRKMMQWSEILDIAVQSAWGLQAAHDSGVIHQDVKPGNILLTVDGTAKITDFGLANIKTPAPAAKNGVSESATVMVSSRGMTPAYCSPEQAAGYRLTRKTDMWSLGVTLLHMINGKLSWKTGVVAPEVLNETIRGWDQTIRGEFPSQIKLILDRCFQFEPEQRWESMKELSSALITVYEDLTGMMYVRAMPCSDHITGKDMDLERSTSWGGCWTPPWESLKTACCIAGVSVSDIYPVPPVRSGSARIKALLDLEILDEVQRIYSAANLQNTPDIHRNIIRMHIDRSNVLYRLDD
ncbi:serine/threonine protein kinase, partial [bacterium]|nr:serine/threonine protein kinase [candidate division CSSED10-310 bacterium]